MSYQVLARKWRPRNFATLVGQEHVVRALTHALSENRLHHAYLFTGTRGVGKTTIARILAKSLNCESGVTATPCGVCSACTEIDAGRFVDLLEVDAATNTRVDEMRQLLENAVYAPTRGRYKVYVIDEVHMLSNSAFNAMLKTLEEPPEHVKFILATTDPQKIPVTVLSRCLQFNLKQMPVAAITSHLSSILDAEGLECQSSALHLLARSAGGSMRDALSLLDQAIAHGAGKVLEAEVRDMLGTVDSDHLFILLESLAADNFGASLKVAQALQERSLSFSSALGELALLLTRVQVAQFSASSIATDDPDRDRIVALAAAWDPEFVQLAYQIVCQGREELHLAPEEYAGFVMTILRLHAFSPDPADTEANLSSSSSCANDRGASQAVKAAPASRETTQVPGENDQAVQSDGMPERWHSLAGRLRLNGMARELAQHCELRELNDTYCLLRLAPAHRHLQIKAAQEKLQQALSEQAGRTIALRIELGEPETETPAAIGERDLRKRRDTAIAAIEQDAFVRDAIEGFDATVVESSIKPIT